MSPINSLIEALFAIYTRAGAEVTYTTDSGDVRPYWANRYRQALQRAVDGDEVVAFVKRLVMQAEPSRGFLYLKEAGRLDLSVEALVVEQFPDMFDGSLVRFASKRLIEHGYQPSKPKAPAGEVALSTEDEELTKVLKASEGKSFSVTITVGPNGALSLKLA